MRYIPRPLFGEFIPHQIAKITSSLSFSMFIAMAGISEQTPPLLIFLLQCCAPSLFLLSIVLFVAPYNNWCISRVEVRPHRTQPSIRLFKFRLLIQINHAAPLFLWMIENSRYKDQAHDNAAAYLSSLGEERAYQRTLLEYGVWPVNPGHRMIHGYKKEGLFKLVPLQDADIPPVDAPWKPEKYYIDILSIFGFLTDMDAQYIETVRISRI